MSSGWFWLVCKRKPAKKHASIYVGMEVVQRYLTKLRKYPGDRELTEIMEWFECLLEILDAEEG